MANENRFGNLMSGLNAGSTDAKPVEKAAPAKTEKKRRQKRDPAPTMKKPSDPSMSRKSDESLVKSKSPDYEKGTYYLPKDLTYQMRVYAAGHRMQMSDLVAFAVSEYLESH